MAKKRPILTVGAISAAVALLSFFPDPAVADAESSATPIVRPTNPAIKMPTSYPFQQPVPLAADFPADASTQRGLTPYDEIAPKINSWLARSNKVSAQVVGTTDLGRDIHFITLTAPETAAETAQQNAWRDKIKNNAAAAATDQALQDGYKIPIWFNANIHGNEWEGTDASIKYIEDMLNDTSAETAELLRTHRIYFTLTNNPDGRALGQRAVAAGFDPNRDFITGATVEASITRDLSNIIQPTNFIDIHGYTNILQVEPCGPPHGENYEYDLFLPHAYDAALEIEKAVVEANIPGNTYQAADGSATTTNTGKILIPYRDIRAGWDDWPPIFAPQYVAFQGAITNTVELPLGRVNNNVPEGTRRGEVNVAVAGVVIDTAVDYVVENSDALLDNQIEIFRRGDAGEPLRTVPADIDPATVPAPNAWAEIWDETDVYTAKLPRAYVIPVGGTQRSDTDANTLVDQLLVNGIEVQKTTSALTANGTTYPTGSYLVDMHQPLRGLANVLLADGTDISERVPDMYDISAWSLSLLWGADVDAIGSTTDAPLAVTATPVTSTPLSSVVPATAAYLELEASGVASIQAINELLHDGVAVSRFDDGTVILKLDETSRQSVSEVTAKYEVTFAASDGQRLRTEDSTGLGAQRVGYTGTQDDRVTLERLGFRDLVLLNAASITSGAADLSQIDVLWIGSNLAFNADQAAGTAAVNAYLASGKGVTGRGTAAANFANTFGLLTTTPVSGTSGSNGIVSVETAADGVLGDFPQDTAFVSPATWFTVLDPAATVEQTYAADPFVSGHWASSAGRAQENSARQAAVVSKTAATGSRVLLFGTVPTYRAHVVGGSQDVATSLLWAGVAGAEVEVPAAVVVPEPTPEPTPVPVPSDSPSATPAPVALPTKPAAGAGTRPGGLANSGSDALLIGGLAAGLLALGAATLGAMRLRGRSAAATAEAPRSVDTVE